MELRSGRRLGSPPRPRPRRSRRPPVFSDGGESDRISDLQDDMLLQILVRLRCARAAAQTSGLSRRWRGLWRHLPELSFRDISADALDAALSQVACPALSLLEVDIPEEHRVMDPARVADLLRAVARLDPADLIFSLWGHCKDRDVPIEIPCFERATSIKLRVYNLFLTPPPRGTEFPLLERLSVARCYIDVVELVLRCPRLRVFKVSHAYMDTVKVHSPTIEELVVKDNLGLSNIDIVTPGLKNFKLSAINAGITVSFSAPMVENLLWYCPCDRQNVGFGENWRLLLLTLRKKENVCVLHMCISAYFSMNTIIPPADRSFSQEIAPLPTFSVLVLNLDARKHVFAALVLHLLGICSTVQSLKVHIGQNWGKETCSPHCPCDQPQNWRNEIISLTALKEVKITGFGGTDHELDFLKLLFRCASLMKSMTVVLAPEFLPTSADCREIYSIFEGTPDVKCSLYRSRCEH